MGSGRCFSKEEILRFLEGEPLRGGKAAEEELMGHLETCEACGRSREKLLEELEGLAHSLSLLWKRERISCPHRDLLAAYLHGSLPKDQTDYVRFHLEAVGCVECQANLEDVREAEGEEEPALRKVRQDVLQSTTAFLKKRR